ncbi:MAG: M28 family peptidase [Planctomycetes bacterium]|nr:M28 family peptidase [Planctomycetota bacterium]
MRSSCLPLLRRAALVVFVALAGCGPAPAVAMERLDKRFHSSEESLFDAKEYLGHIATLADDKLEGRGTGQEGIDMAAEYIVDHFKKLGVKPAGDNGTYFQNFTLKLKSKIGDGTRLAIGTDDAVSRKKAKLGTDYTPFPFSGRGDFKGEVVFVGYGLADDDYDDYKDMDVAGKVVLMLRRAPKFKEGDFMSSSFRAKASKANSRDAAAILIVNPSFDEDGDKLYEFGNEQMGGMMSMGRAGYGVPMMQVRRAVADRMLKAGGLDSLDELEKKIEKTKSPCSAELKGVSVKGRIEIEPIETPVRNIVAMIPGTGPQKDEFIILGGHYDHLGIRHKGEKEFDATKDISNGADDNASGTAMVMNMAKVYTQGRKPNRSILLMLYTGEELGLLGSAHFANEPTIDLDKAIAMLNFDMVGRLKDDKLEVGGMKTGGFEEMVMQLAEPYNLKIKNGGGGRGPSDHTSFYNKNIPVLFFFTGIHKQYHQPTDDTPLINTEGAIRIGKFAADIIDEIDAKAERPVFVKDNTRASIARQDDGDEKGDAVAAAQPRRGEGRGPGQGRGQGNRPRMGFRPDMNADAEGIVVGEVMEGGAAEKAGIKEGDCIKEINGKKVKAAIDMFEVMQTLKWGDTAKIALERGGKKMKFEMKFERPAEDQVARADGAARGEGAGRGEGGRPARTETRTSDDASDVKQVLSMLKNLIDLKDGSAEVSIKVDSSKKDVFEVTLRFKKQADAKADAPAPREQRQERRNRRDDRSADAAPRQRPAPKDDDPHGGATDDTQAAEMPPVRLGIMPTYGDSEGEGYEISGVVEGGPAARAGIKDNDRIYKIGDKKITNVYEYMDALRQYKAGDEVPVTVLRDGKKINIKVKSAAQQRKEAA